MCETNKTPANGRQEGFPGQQIAVASPSVAKYHQETLVDGFTPTAAGYFPRARGHHVKRTAALADAIFLLCVDGTGWLELKDKRLAMRPGDVGYIPANRTHAYGAHPKTPWSLAWFHVNGAEVDKIAAVLTLNPASPTCQVGSIERDLPLIDELCQLLRPPNQLAQVRTASVLLRQWFAHAAQRRASAPHEASLVERIQISVDWMRSNLHRPIRLVDLAGQAQLSASRYSQVFRQLYGRPPIDFCTARRVGVACELLATTPLKIGQIAENVGYSDPLHFSRVFRREMKQSPTQYRKTHSHNNAKTDD